MKKPTQKQILAVIKSILPTEKIEIDPHHIGHRGNTIYISTPPKPNQLHIKSINVYNDDYFFITISTLYKNDLPLNIIYNNPNIIVDCIATETLDWISLIPIAFNSFGHIDI